MNLDIKLISLTVAGLLNMVKCHPISRGLKQQRADIICLLETHLKLTEGKLLHYIYKGNIYQASSGQIRKGNDWNKIWDPMGPITEKS